MADFDPLDFDIEKLRARFEQRNSKPWKQPSSPLPIDLSVSKLQKRNRYPKLRSPEDLSACPYAIARDGVQWAATYATIRLNQNELRTDATAAMQVFSKEVGEGIAVIRKLHGALATIYGAQEDAFDPDVDALSKSQLRDTDYLLAAYSLLQRLEKPIRGLSIQRSQRVGNIWRIEFATALFRTWWLLTGRDPSPQGEFLEFVEGAYQSLGEELPEMHWESAIKTAMQNVEREHGANVQPWREDRAPAAVTPRISSCQVFDTYAVDVDSTFT